MALHFDKADELAVYRRLAGIRTAYAFCAGGNPTLDSVANFIQTYEKGFLGKQIVDRAFSKYHVAR